MPCHAAIAISMMRHARVRYDADAAVATLDCLIFAAASSAAPLHTRAAVMMRCLLSAECHAIFAHACATLFNTLSCRHDVATPTLRHCLLLLDAYATEYVTMPLLSLRHYYAVLRLAVTAVIYAMARFACRACRYCHFAPRCVLCCRCYALMPYAIFTMLIFVCPLRCFFACRFHVASLVAVSPPMPIMPP